MKYYVTIDGKDGVDLPTTSEPMPLDDVGNHIAQKLKLYRVQGYFFNCKQERIPVDELSFRVVPEDSL